MDMCDILTLNKEKKKFGDRYNLNPDISIQAVLTPILFFVAMLTICVTPSIKMDVNLT